MLLHSLRDSSPMINIIYFETQTKQKKLDIENSSQYPLVMEKCHCARVPFDQIVKLAMHAKCSYERIAKDLNAGETCTACREDMRAYCESAGASNSQLQLQGAL